jgi:hypothetical protein
MKYCNFVRYFAELMFAVKKALEKKSKEPVMTTRALFLACIAPIRIADLPTAKGYLKLLL